MHRAGKRGGRLLQHQLQPRVGKTDPSTGGETNKNSLSIFSIFATFFVQFCPFPPTKMFGNADAFSAGPSDVAACDDTLIISPSAGSTTPVARSPGRGTSTWTTWTRSAASSRWSGCGSAPGPATATATTTTTTMSIGVVCVQVRQQLARPRPARPQQVGRGAPQHHGDAAHRRQQGLQVQPQQQHQQQHLLRVSR